MQQAGLWTVEAYGGHLFNKTQHVSILLRWCHPSVLKTWQSSFTQKHHILANISTVASETDAMFMFALGKTTI